MQEMYLVSCIIIGYMVRHTALQGIASIFTCSGNLYIRYLTCERRHRFGAALMDLDSASRLGGLMYYNSNPSLSMVI